MQTNDKTTILRAPPGLYATFKRGDETSVAPLIAWCITLGDGPGGLSGEPLFLAHDTGALVAGRDLERFGTMLVSVQNDEPTAA